MTAYERLVDRLRDMGRKVVERGSQTMAQCPAHDDNNPSLSVKGIEGQVLVKCFAGCTVEDVVAALGFTMADLFDQPSGARYNYTDPIGRILRTVERTPSKKFLQSGPKKSGKDATLYRLPEIIEAVAAGRTIYLVEGEKDVHTLETLGVVATTAPMGAASFKHCDVSPLHGADVIAIVDKDEDGEGKKWAEQVKAALTDNARSLTFKEAKTGKDASDHILDGHDLDDLVDVDEPVVFLRRARITWADQIEPEPVIWAWEDGENGRIPAGSLSLAAGREGTGKSSFGIWKAAHITEGTLPGAYYGSPRRVLYVSVEDSWKHTLVPRLMAAGADRSRIGRFEVVSIDDDELTLSLPHDNDLLEREIKKYGVALVVIDPLMSVIGERIDTHREREVRSALDPLAKMADRTGSIFLGIAHFNKGGGTDAASLITGSGAFKNVPRSVFGFARDEADEAGGRIMTQVKNSLGRDDLPSLRYVIEPAEIVTRKGITTTGRFTFTGETDRSVGDVLRDSRAGSGDADERRELDQWLLDYLTAEGGAVAARDVIRDGKDCGFSEDAIKKARIRIKATSERQGFGKGSSVVWSIGAHIGAIDATNEKPAPMAPMAAPMEISTTARLCPECDQPLEAGKVRHGPCYLRSIQRDRIEGRSA